MFPSELELRTLITAMHSIHAFTLGIHSSSDNFSSLAKNTVVYTDNLSPAVYGSAVKPIHFVEDLEVANGD